MHRFLFWLTRNRPCRLIDTDGQRYLERYYMGRLFGLTFYLHRFVSGDGDRQLHDHPWRMSVSVILAGWYREQVMRFMCPYTGVRTSEVERGPGSINVIGGGKFHQIIEARPNTWTLFIHGERVKFWGFLHHDERDETIVYHNPFPPSRDDWHKKAVPARAVGRAPVDYKPLKRVV